MKLQVAIDRVDVPAAMEMIRQVEAYADIVEIGTSLIKDFGLENSVGALTRTFPAQDFLADIKTCDEGAYEFRKTYEAGAAVATVMGFSSSATIRACAEVADAFGRDYLIPACDLLYPPALGLRGRGARRTHRGDGGTAVRRCQSAAHRGSGRRAACERTAPQALWHRDRHRRERRHEGGGSCGGSACVS